MTNGIRADRSQHAPTISATNGIDSRPVQTDKHNRHSIRLRGYDYSRPGTYFVTLCVKNSECLFGEIINGKMELNEYGQIVQKKWNWLVQQYRYVKLDEWVVMPNHIHGIIWITDHHRRGGTRPAPTFDVNLKTSTPTQPFTTCAMKIKPVGLLIGAFKTVSAKQIDNIRNTPGVPVWQRDYFDHIVRDGDELDRIRQYIRNNPSIWNNDDENPGRKPPRFVALPNPQRHYI